MERIVEELGQTVRGLLRRPAFSAVVVAVMGLGIGADAAVFSLVRATLLRPLPFDDPEELVRVRAADPHTGYEISVSVPNFRDWREESRAFTAMGGLLGRTMTLTGIDRPEAVDAQWVVGDLFDALGLQAERGRLFGAGETFEAAPAVAVVSHGFWRERLGSDPDALGRTLVLDDVPFEVVGVLPEGVRFPDAEPRVYLPLGWFGDRVCWDRRDCSVGLWTVARLAPGSTRASAAEDLERVVAAVEERVGESVAEPSVEPLRTTFVGSMERWAWPLLGAVLLLLLIACANVGGLLLARNEARAPELAVRRALGAGRRGLLRLLLLEGMVLTAAAGLAGALVSAALVHGLEPLVARRVPTLLLSGLRVDGQVFLHVVGITAVVGLLVIALPAVRMGLQAPAPGLRQGGARGGTGRSAVRARSTLVAGQVALAFVLLVAAGLLARTLQGLSRVDPGFEPAGVLAVEVPLPAARYGEKPVAWAFYRQLLERARALPGVEAASLSNLVPLAGGSWERRIWPEDVAVRPETGSSVLYGMVSPGHFDVLRIPVLRGRGFTSADRSGSPPVTVVDETLARRFWPGEDPVGRRVTFEWAVDEAGDTTRVWREVVGVTRNVRHYEIESPSRIQVYVPFEQSGGQWSRDMELLVRTAGEPGLLAEPVRSTVQELDPGLPLGEVRTAGALVDDALSTPRTLGLLLGVFGLAALGLTGLGLFGVVSLSVSQRTREMGIRTALGAGTGDVVGLVLRQGMAVAGVGVGVGIVAALGAGRLLGAVLWGVGPRDPVVYGSAALFLGLVCAGATLIPARRAASVEPARVLRDE